jgi:hypothetical protein
VLYGLGKLNRPRCGRNPEICAEVIVLRVDDDVAESMKPPVWARASSEPTKAKTAARPHERIKRREFSDKRTSWPSAWQTGIDTAQAANFTGR